MGNPDLRVEQPEPDRAVVVLAGEHDQSTAPELRSLLMRLVAESRVVVADLSTARFADSTTLNVLVQAKVAANARDCRFRVQMGPDALLHRLFAVAGLLDAMEGSHTRTGAGGSGAAGGRLGALVRLLTGRRPGLDIALTSRPYSGAVLRPIVSVALAGIVCALVAASAPAAERADASVFGGLGTWVDIYDGVVYASPERTAQRMAARNIKTVWVETANYGAPVDVVDPVRLGRFVDALQARGMRAVAWYLPGHVKPALDTRRALAMLSFRTPRGGRFDGIALNIESTRLRNVGLRSRRAVALTRELRAEAGDVPLAIVPFNPRGLERRPSTWPRFPWAELAESADAFAPMAYTGGAYKGFDATYGYVTRALRLLRAQAGPDVQIHVAGGVADRLGRDELQGFVAAVADDGGTIGVSLYDWMTTPPAAWAELARLTR